MWSERGNSISRGSNIKTVISIIQRFFPLGEKPNFWISVCNQKSSGNALFMCSALGIFSVKSTLNKRKEAKVPQDLQLLPNLGADVVVQGMLFRKILFKGVHIS